MEAQKRKKNTATPDSNIYAIFDRNLSKRLFDKQNDSCMR